MESVLRGRWCVCSPTKSAVCVPANVCECVGSMPREGLRVSCNVECDVWFPADVG